MMKVSSNGRELSVRLGNKGVKMVDAIEKTMRSQLEYAKEKARGVLLQIIYSRPENPEFPRSLNLLQSTETLFKNENGVHTFYIYNDPSKATNEYNWVGRDSSWSYNLGSYSGAEKYYPIYVSQGNFFGRKVSITNFYDAWMSEVAVPIGEKIIKAARVAMAG